MQRIPVIIDTDIGTDIDDTWALTMALGCDEIDIRLICTCTGDTAFRARVVCKLLEAAGRTDIPVAVGVPFDGGNEMQADWVADYQLDQYPGTVYADGVAAMADVIMSSEEEVALVCIGPLPNISELLRVSPAVTGKARFIGMHGSVYKGYFGTDEVHAEYNVKQHLPDAQAVFASSFPMTITPLDTCGIVRLSGENYASLRDGTGSTLGALFENYEVWLSAIGKDPAVARETSSVLFDTVAIYLAFAEDLLEMSTLSIKVNDDGLTQVSDMGKSMRVATQWKDLPAFERFLVGRLLAAP